MARHPVPLSPGHTPGHRIPRGPFYFTCTLYVLPRHSMPPTAVTGPVLTGRSTAVTNCPHLSPHSSGPLATQGSSHTHIICISPPAPRASATAHQLLTTHSDICSTAVRLLPYSSILALPLPWVSRRVAPPAPSILHPCSTALPSLPSILALLIRHHSR